MGQTKKIRVLVADDHQLVIDGLYSLLQGEKDIELIGQANNGSQVLSQLKHLSTDIVLMDIGMPEMDGYETTLEVTKKYPAVKIIALTMYAEKAIINKMMDAGAKGYILKNVNKAELLSAIRTVFEGSKYFNSELTLSLLNQAQSPGESKLPVFSERETEILRLIVDGFSSTEIGKKLFISSRTVETHRANMMSKLEVKNVAGLIREAIRKGLA